VAESIFRSNSAAYLIIVKLELPSIMSVLVELIALGIAFLAGVTFRRYFILTSGEQKTNLPFIKTFNILTGSNNIIFTNNKILAVNAHDRHLELGDTFGCYFGQNMQVFSRDPDLIYKICVTDFQKHRNRYYVDSLSPYMKASLLEARDDKWQTSRRAIGSVLKASKLKMDNVDTDIDITINKMLLNIDKRLEKQDTTVDVYQINKNFFLQSILKIIYDTEELVDFKKERNDVVENLHNFINVNYEFVARMCFLIPILTHLVRPMLGFFDHGKYLGLLTEKLEKILRRTLGAAREKQKEGHLTTIHSLINSYRKGELSHQQLMGNAVFLMIAGFATSVDTMSTMMWHLAKNQDVQDRLRADIQQYGEKSKYLEQCINETLRLFPGSITNRDLSEDVYHRDFRLVKGLCFNVSIYSLHRDPKYWGPDAEEWKPERFDASNTSKFHPAQFIPFGIGPRNCVGYNLAKLELIKFTAQFFLKYKLEFCPKTQSKLEFVPLGALPFALPIKGPIYLKLQPVEAN
jgi:cytochrome P450 family 6